MLDFLAISYFPLFRFLPPADLPAGDRAAAPAAAQAARRRGRPARNEMPVQACQPYCMRLLLACALTCFALASAAAATSKTPIQQASSTQSPEGPAGGISCSSDLDCQLNGACTKGACVCDKGWRGTDCGTLNLNNTANVAYGYTPESKFSCWGGGPPTWDPASGKYQLLV